MSAYDEAQKIDASKGWAANSKHFEAAAVALVGPWKVAYDRASAADKKQIEEGARDYVGSEFVRWDALLDWDFPIMPDYVEDYFLYVYGAAKARHVLTGQLRLL